MNSKVNNESQSHSLLLPLGHSSSIITSGGGKVAKDHLVVTFSELDTAVHALNCEHTHHLQHYYPMAPSLS
jgi:hypothetical protein